MGVGGVLKQWGVAAGENPVCFGLKLGKLVVRRSLVFLAKTRRTFSLAAHNNHSAA